MSNDQSYVPQYSSDEDQDLSDNENTKPTQTQQKLRGRAKAYEMVDSFESLESAKHAIKEENKAWKFKTKYDTVDGIKYSYKCIKGCKKTAYIACPHESMVVELYVSNHESMVVPRKYGRRIVYSTNINVFIMFFFLLFNPKKNSVWGTEKIYLGYGKNLFGVRKKFIWGTEKIYLGY